MHEDDERGSAGLVERKQRAARARIVAAADALFAERGFDGVSVTDIAARAEVGRTTFFRHFTDKTEVVFAEEQAMVEAVAVAVGASWSPEEPVDTLAGALRALEPVVLQLCERSSADRDAHRRHAELVSGHVELRARELVKHQDVAERFAAALAERGAPREVATVAGHVAVACYSSGRVLVADPGDLVDATAAAFRAVLAPSGR